MTQDQIKQLEKELWYAADALRANSKLTAAEYKDPVLVLVLLRFAQNKYEEATPIVQKKIPTGPRVNVKQPKKIIYLPVLLCYQKKQSTNT